MAGGWMFCSSESGSGMARNNSQRLLKGLADRSIAGLQLKASREPVGNRNRRSKGVDISIDIYL